jgi:mono/diheme cytochrome c family protein
LRTYSISRRDNPYYDVATKAGAPSGIALSQDEQFAFVYCRSTDDVVAVRLVQGEGQYTAVPPAIVRLASETPDEGFALGRSLFYNATDTVTSGGLACAGCHPDGRDDGYVWHEATFHDGEIKQDINNFLASAQSITGPLTISLAPIEGGYGCGSVGAFDPVPATIEGEADNPRALGHPRQTPMLAGRAGASGPYGWHGESKDLPARIVAGFGLHRWTRGTGAPENLQARALHLAKFLREGLVAPARSDRPLTGEEQRGKAIFESGETQCARCHVPSSGFTDRMPVPLAQPPAPPGFVKEENTAFKTPSLMYVGNTPPYFHDGRFESLAALIDQNADRMGKTAQLSAEEKKALVAYLETL